jgi:tetratricopeptide (TPR) repeat protein
MKEHLFSIEEAETHPARAATYLAENIASGDGHAEAMKEIVAHYVAEKDVDTAAQLADTVDDPFVRDRLLLLVAEKCAELDDDEYALQLVDAIEENGFQSVARERLAMRKAAIGEFDKALELAETLPHSSDALAVVAAEQAAAGLEAESEKTLARIEFPYAKVNALLSIATSYEAKDEREKALAAVVRAVEAARDIEFKEEKIRALQDAATHFEHVKANDKAIETLAKVREEAETLDGVHRENFLSQIALGFLRAGSLDLAERTLDLIGDKVLIASTLAGYSMNFDEKGERADALETLEEAYQILKSQSEREVRSSKDKFALFGTIALLFAKYEKLERGIEVALEIRDESTRYHALNQIAQVCALAGQDDAAHDVLNLIDEDSERLFAFIGLSDIKRKAEKRDEALNYLREARNYCENVPQLQSRSQAYNGIARRFHDLGDEQAARAAAHENLETISQIRDSSAQAASLLRLADVYKSLDFDLTEDERSILRTMLRRAEW